MCESEILVAVISDTHRLLRPEAIAAPRGADVIIHAGDVGHAEPIEEPRGVAPTFMVRGKRISSAGVPLKSGDCAMPIPDCAACAKRRLRDEPLQKIAEAVWPEDLSCARPCRWFARVADF